jgi:hypothetical protein
MTNMFVLCLPAIGILTLAPSTAPAPAPATPASIPCAVLDDEEYDRRVREAGRDTDALWDLYLWCLSTERDREATSVLNRILRVDPEHTQAHEKLCHNLHDGQWFTSEKKLEGYKEKEARRRAKELGQVRWEDEWVHPDEIPLLEQGYVRDPADGGWIL